MPQNSRWHRLPENQVVKFLFSAGLGFLVDIFAFYLFFHALFTKDSYQLFGYKVGNYNLSFSISFFMGVVVNFLVNRYLVFTESTLSPLRQFLRFLLVAIVGYFANLWLLNIYIRNLHLYPPVARPAAALSLFIASFFVHKFFSFNLSLRNQHHAAQPNHKPGN
ncbi:GtrA family protein [Mucilaginibacter sp.]